MRGGTAFNIREVLIACRALETAMAGLYDTLAEIHADVPAMAKLWTKTANDERNHDLQFGLALEISNEVVEAVRVDLPLVEGTLRAIEMRRREWLICAPTVEQALSVAIALEEALSSLHADQIPVFATDSHRKLFAAMMAADREHVGRLRRALAFCPSTATGQTASQHGK